ncbi:MAG: pyruvate ferredoxin oxidoreductase [Desulfobacterales bacterium]|nr:pyruvate ferredoxin oxidoreductase [Desulfobacterales bacterium]
MAKRKRIGMEVALAAAEAVGMCNVDVAAVYPITPQSHIAEHLSDLVADGKTDTEYVTVESEHSSMSVCIGASATGARAYTATCAQGLMLMHELLPIASAMRCPIVMSVANRPVNAPLNILSDHSDIMPQRDSGWIVIFSENGQEVVDLTLQAYRIAEDKDVMLPVIICIDGFILTHMVEPMEFPDQEEMDKFLPPYKPYATLYPDKPLTMGAFAMPDFFPQMMKAKDMALLNSKKTIVKVWDEWEKKFGRRYRPVETYRAKGAEVILVTMGSMSETAELGVDELRDKGISAGLVKIRLWRPFPSDELKVAVKGARVLALMDRAISPGVGGAPVFTDVKAAFYGEESRPIIVNYVMGLGGTDVTVGDFVKMGEKAAKAKKEEYEFYGVR